MSSLTEPDHHAQPADDRAHDARWMPQTPPVDNGRDGATSDRRSLDERREQLVDAAVAILAEEGLARATTRNITDRAGLALGAFHYVFDSKDDLLAAVMERVLRATQEALTRAVDHEGPTTMTELLDAFWRFIDAAPQLQLAKAELTVHALRDPALRPLMEEQYERYTATVRELAVDAVLSSEDGDTLARYLVATLDGLVLQRLVEGDAGAARDRLDLHAAAVETLTPN